MPEQESMRLKELGAQMTTAARKIAELAESDYNTLILNYFAAIDDPSVSMWGVHGDEYKALEGQYLDFIKGMEAVSMAQFINLGSCGVVYTMKANKRAGYDGVLGFNVESDIHAYHLMGESCPEIIGKGSFLAYAYNGLIFLDMQTLVKYLVCQTYRLGKVKPIIDPESFNRLLFDDQNFRESQSIREAEKFIRDYLVT